MHIEIGILSPDKLAYAAAGASALLGAHAMGLLKSPTAWLRTALAHLAVNFLSLAVPLVTVHHLLGRRMRAITVANVLKLDAVYYAGVTLMVGFWLWIGSDAAALSDWALFAASYISLVAVEPLLTLGLTVGASRLRQSRWLAARIDEGMLQRVPRAA